jgi:hypothetical protein
MWPFQLGRNGLAKTFVDNDFGAERRGELALPEGEVFVKRP